MVAQDSSRWGVDEVAAWLRDVGLDALQERFRENAVNGDDLQTLTDEDLLEELRTTPLQLRKLRSEMNRAGLRSATPYAYMPSMPRAASAPPAPCAPSPAPCAPSPAASAPRTPPMARTGSIVTAAPIPGFECGPPATPALPGQAIVGWEVCRHPAGFTFRGMSSEGHVSFWVMLVFGLWPCCLFPFCMDDCFGQFQRPIYADPGA